MSESNNNDISTSFLISVIVPIYKVEKYLGKCIESIIRQSYSNLEIILVDDGSPDRCGAICDEYARKDSRIKVIHQDNMGLSVARNTGLNIATGEYITFVDSDDWIDQNFIKLLLKSMLKSNAQIAVTSLLNVYEDGTTKSNTLILSEIRLSKTEGLACYLFNGYLTPCACGKLWKKNLWEGIRFPEGKLFEDQFTTYKVLEKADTIIFSPSNMYFYLKRPCSIGHSSFSERTYNLYEGINEQYEYLSNKYPQIENELAIGKIVWELVFINMTILSRKETDYRDIFSKTQRFILKNFNNVIETNKLPVSRKIQILLFYFSFPIYKSFYLALKKFKSVS
ncbi:glycosyltransferase family 2 protein [uncultured Succinivibrio sp.]|uniref:glycosyltransferase family 2 protein n=1 Tax=uncultured Succinivibrio sp. TaxID=540749 RepID=UPI0025CC28AB|nr:glycosyltransferase family 2 protein [uncultured Succinivibrio sp.]